MGVITDTLSNTITKGAVVEEMSLGRAAMDEIRGNRRYQTEQEAISNESIGKGDVLLETYRVISDEIRGGMGSVWLVHHKAWNMDLAMKRPQPMFFAEAGDGKKKDFIDECEYWINLGLHPNIVSCYYVREIGGIPSVFSEWMDNGSLKDRIRDGSLYEGTEEEVRERILDIAIQSAQGLAYAHKAGLVHQDVKPGNILLTKDWEAKVADFGLAKARSRLTGHMEAVSTGYTKEYCPEEQTACVKAEAWMDTYAWALTVAEMFTGKRLWDTGAEAAVRFPFAEDEKRLTMGEDILQLIGKCLSKESSPDFEAVVQECLQLYEIYAGHRFSRKTTRAVDRSADHMSNCAASFLDLGKEDNAIAMWEQAVKTNPDCVAAVYNLALYKYRKGLIDDSSAVMSVSALDDGTSDSPEILLAIARIQAECRNPDLSATLERLRKTGKVTDQKELTGLEQCAGKNRLDPIYRYEEKKDEHADISPDGQYLLIHQFTDKNHDEEVIFCRADDKKKISNLIRKLDDKQPSEVRVKLSGDNATAYGMYHQDPVLYRWRTDSGEQTGNCVMNKLPGEEIVSFDTDGKGEWTVLGSNRGRILLFNPVRKIVRNLVIVKGDYCIGISENGEHALLSSIEEDRIFTFGNDGKKQQEIIISRPVFASFAMEDKNIITIGGAEDPVISLFEVETGKKQWSVPFPRMYEFTEMRGTFSISADGRRILLRVDRAYVIFDIFRKKWLFSITDKLLGYSINEVFKMRLTGKGDELYIQSYLRGLTGYRLPEFEEESPWHLSVIHTTRERLEEEDAFLSACRRAEEARHNGDIAGALAYMKEAAETGDGNYRAAKEYISLVRSLRSSCDIFEPGLPLLLEKRRIMAASISRLSVSPDGKWIASFAEDRSMTILKAEDGEAVYTDMNRKYALRKPVFWRGNTIYALVQNDAEEQRFMLDEPGGGSISIKFAGQSLGQKISGSIFAFSLEEADNMSKEELKRKFDEQKPHIPMARISDFVLLKDAILYHRSDGPVCRYSEEEGTRVLFMLGSRYQISALAVSPDKKTAVQCVGNILELGKTDPPEIIFFNPDNGAVLYRSRESVISSICGFSTRGRWIQSGNILTDISTGNSIKTGMSSLLDMVFLEERFAICTEENGPLKVIGLPGGEEIQTVSIGEPPTAMAVSRDECILYAGNAKGELLTLLLDHKYEVKTSDSETVDLPAEASAVTLYTEKKRYFWEGMPAQRNGSPTDSHRWGSEQSNPDNCSMRTTKRGGLFGWFRK